MSGITANGGWQRWRDSLTAAALVGALGCLAAAVSSPVDASDLYKPADAEAGTDIPAAEVKFGMRP